MTDNHEDTGGTRGGRRLRWAGAAGMLGGALWVVATLIHAAKPRGCVGEECAIRPMRQSSAVDGVLMLTSLILMAVAIWGVVGLARRSGRFGRAGRIGTALAAAGVAVLVLSAVVQGVLYRGDFPLMPYFVIPGVGLLVAGVATLGIAVLRSRVLPRWAAGLLVVGAVSLLFFNEQTDAVLLAVPLGVAVAGVGFVLWSSTPTTHTGVDERPA